MKRTELLQEDTEDAILRGVGIFQRGAKDKWEQPG